MFKNPSDMKLLTENENKSKSQNRQFHRSWFLERLIDYVFNWFALTLRCVTCKSDESA